MTEVLRYEVGSGTILVEADDNSYGVDHPARNEQGILDVGRRLEDALASVRPAAHAALEQKAIDGQENPLTVINANKFYEVQKHVVLSNHQYNPQSVLISKKFWDTLSAAEKKIVEDAAKESAKYQRQQARSQVAVALDNMKKNGMQVTEFPAAEVNKLRDKLRPVTARYGVIVGQDTVKELQDQLASMRK